MNPLIISGFGVSINVDKRKLIISNKLENNKIEFLPHQINHDSIIIDGHTGNITFEAMRWLAKHDINLTLLNWNCNLLSVTLPQGPKSGRLKIKQYQKYLDNKIRYEIAQEITRNKIINSVNLLSELSRFYSEINFQEIQKLIERENNNYFKENKPLITNNSIKFQLNNLMSYEGRIADIYWENLIKIVRKLSPEFNFTSRKNKSHSWNNNASDEVNALLNYGYSILESEIRKIINIIGLESTIGFLHEIGESKTPLIYDIQELFRWIIDLSVIELLEEKKLKKSDFIVTENYHIRLREKTAKLLVEKISVNFNRKVPYKNKSHTYQNILFDNIQSLVNFILEKSSRVEFNIPRIQIQRDDDVALRERILNMSIEERKRLGISKTTLWHQKKNLMGGKRIRVYDKTIAKIN